MDEEKITRIFVDAMAAAGVDPSCIYAFTKTGFIATDENWDTLSPEQRANWTAAIREVEQIDTQ